MYQKFIKKIKLLHEIVRPKRLFASLTLFVTVCTSLTETFGISLILPFLGTLLNGNPGDLFTKYLGPFLRLFPKERLLVALLLLMVGAVLLKVVFIILREYMINRLAWSFSDYWYRTIATRYLFSKYAYILNEKQGVLVNNLHTEPAKAAKVIINILDFISCLLLSTFLYLTLFIAHWRVTISLTLVVGALFILNRFFFKSFTKNAGAERLRLGLEQMALTSEAILAMKMIKTFSLEKSVFEKFTALNKKCIDLYIKFEVLKSIPVPVVELVVMIILSSLIFFLNQSNGRSIQEILPLLGLVIIVARKLLSYVPSLLVQVMTIDFMLPSLKLVYELTSEPYEKEKPEIGLKFEKLESDIVFDNVSFGYTKNRLVFSNLSLVFPRNKMTALVGPSGIGKSTIADLLIGLVRPSEGRILINGINLSEFSLKSWRGKIGFVSQDTIVLNTTIEENIRFGNMNATVEEVHQAAKMASIHDYICSLPRGYNTHVGDRGLKLSGGQRQRIAIARTIVRKPEIYIFDEATSSLDQETEKFIQSEIEKLSKDNTVVVIAHRLSTIEKADRVYDLEKLFNQSSKECLNSSL